MALLSRKPVPISEIPRPGDERYEQWLSDLTVEGLRIVNSLHRWTLSSHHEHSTVLSYVLPSGHHVRKEPAPPYTGLYQPKHPDPPIPLKIAKDEFWAGRRSVHYLEGGHVSNIDRDEEDDLPEVVMMGGSPRGSVNGLNGVGAARGSVDGLNGVESRRSSVAAGVGGGGVNGNGHINGNGLTNGNAHVPDALNSVPESLNGAVNDDDISHPPPLTSSQHDSQTSATTASASSTTSTQRADPGYFHCKRPAGVYEAFRDGLFRDHTMQESEYIESAVRAEKVEVVEEGRVEIWRMVYDMPTPLKQRDFLFCIITNPILCLPPHPTPCRALHPAPPPLRQFMVITIPITHPNFPEKGQGIVRGYYASVELVRELDVTLSGYQMGTIEGGERKIRGLEWRMATTSDPGGNVPQFLTNKSLPGKVVEDVPSYIEWLEKQNPSIGKVASKKLAF